MVTLLSRATSASVARPLFRLANSVYRDSRRISGKFYPIHQPVSDSQALELDAV
jgi:hypothetical protein